MLLLEQPRCHPHAAGEMLSLMRRSRHAGQKQLPPTSTSNTPDGLSMHQHFGNPATAPQTNGAPHARQNVASVSGSAAIVLSVIAQHSIDDPALQ